MYFNPIDEYMFTCTLLYVNYSIQQYKFLSWNHLLMLLDLILSEDQAPFICDALPYNASSLNQCAMLSCNT